MCGGGKAESVGQCGAAWPAPLAPAAATPPMRSSARSMPMPALRLPPPRPQSEYSAVREACKEMGDPGAECEPALGPRRAAALHAAQPQRRRPPTISLLRIPARSPCPAPPRPRCPQTRRPSRLWWFRSGITPASSRRPRTSRTATAAATSCLVSRAGRGRRRGHRARGEKARCACHGAPVRGRPLLPRPSPPTPPTHRHGGGHGHHPPL